MLYYYCRNFPNDQPDFPNMLILKKLGVNHPPPPPPIPHFATALVIAFQVNRLSSLDCSPPRHIVCQFQSLYMPSPRGPLPRHIVYQFQSSYTPSPHRLSQISVCQHVGVSMHEMAVLHDCPACYRSR